MATISDEEQVKRWVENPKELAEVVLLLCKLHSKKIFEDLIAPKDSK